MTAKRKAHGKVRKILVSLLLTLCLLAGTLGQTASAAAYNVPDNMQWWTQDKFGMFIHFGSYSYYGHGEWAMQTEKISKEKYQETVSAKFDPVHFDAEKIVAYAKKAGMKYLSRMSTYSP